MNGVLSQDAIDFIGRRAAWLSLVEVGLGSVIHGFKIPLGGHALSLYQTYFLTRASIEGESVGVARKSPYLISNVAAVLKSLSPAGNKLGPMLSISMQGFLFTMGNLLPGPRILAHGLGAALMSLWAFLQPLITYFVFFGTDLYRAIDFFLKKAVPFEASSLAGWLALLVATKIMLAWGAVVLATYFRRAVRLRELETRMMSLGTRLVPRPDTEGGVARLTIIKRALRDLLRIPFLVSLALTGAFFWYSQRDAVGIWIYLLRPIAIAFVFFYLSRSLFLIQLVGKLEGTRFEGWSRSVRVAIENLRERAAIIT